MESQRVTNPLPPSLAKTISWVNQHYLIQAESCRFWQNANWQLRRRQVWDSFMLYVIKGCVQVELEHDVVMIPAGHMLLLPDGAWHRLKQVGDEPHLEQFALHAYINNRWGESLFTRLSSPVIKMPNPAYWTKALHHLTSVMMVDEHAGRLLLTAQLRMLVHDLIIAGLPISIETQVREPRIDHALTLIHENLTRDWSVAELATEVALGVVQFRKLFKQHMQHTPRMYMTHCRIQESCRLLQYTDHKIKDIARDVGFQSDYYFQRIFKKSTGITPTTFRQNIRSSI